MTAEGVVRWFCEEYYSGMSQHEAAKLEHAIQLAIEEDRQQLKAENEGLLEEVHIGWESARIASPLQEEVCALKAQVAKLIELVRSAEWADEFDRCPWCKGHAPVVLGLPHGDGHKPDCPARPYLEVLPDQAK